MEYIQSLLEMEMSVAEIECREKYGCRSGADCFKCELLKRSCVKSYVAERLLKKFNISVKEENEEAKEDGK